MLISLTEPTSPRYLWLNPMTNVLHVLLPVVSGSQIGLDNTCKSVYGLQEFFGKSRDVNQRAIQDELKGYEKALEFDLSLLHDESELKTKKQERLAQIKRYLKAIEDVLISSVLEPLSKVFPEYPAPLQAIMRREDSNLHSMVLRPKDKDNFLRSVNPVFSLQRAEGASVFYQTLSEAYQNVKPPQDAKARLIAAVESSPEGLANDFEGMQRILREQTQQQLGVDIDYTHDPKDANKPVTKALIDEVMMAEEENPPAAKDYIEMLLGQCAPTLFDALVESPFYTIKNPEQLSIVTQFFLGSVNFYCKAQGLSSLNFGQVLDAQEVLSQEVAGMVLSLQQSGLPIEDALLDVLDAHAVDFGLLKPLTPVERVQIKDLFKTQFAEVKESPHFDEFTLLDHSKPDPFLVHQGCIGLNFAEFLATGFNEFDPEWVARLKHDFQTRQVPITHQNLSVHASLELSIEELLQHIKDEDQLQVILKRLPQDQQAALLASPQIKALQAPKFLLQVARGQQPEAEQLLQANPEAQQDFLIYSGEFTDYSGRTFNCSAYEYAYWAKDTHMQRMLEKNMDETTKAIMLQKCEAIEAQGLTYTQKGQIQTSKHFDFTPLKTALQTYVQSYPEWERTNNLAAMKAAWMLVGKAQRDVPAHVAQEYCRPDRVFYPLPQFNEATLPRVLTFFNWATRREELWFPLKVSEDSGLGVDFTLIRQGMEIASTVRVGRIRDALRFDLAAVSRLDEVRTADLSLSLNHLKPIEPESEARNVIQ